VTAISPDLLKGRVREYWDVESCGEIYATGDDLAARMGALRRARYDLEPYIESFADFKSGHDRDVLEIGVGMGCDHLRWAEAGPSSLTGVDLTDRAIEFTREHLALQRLTSHLRQADAEKLPFEDAKFDRVYSWGVLHHSPNTPRAIEEVLRVLRPGGVARVMIYHRWSMTGYMLWARYGLLVGRPWRSLASIYASHLESPGTKAYTRNQTREMFGGFGDVTVEIQLNHGDLLQGEVGQRHRGPLLRMAKLLWPRWVIRNFFPRHGLYLMITATK
jgi:SAM-dependent methyltransferase